MSSDRAREVYRALQKLAHAEYQGATTDDRVTAWDPVSRVGRED